MSTDEVQDNEETGTTPKTKLKRKSSASNFLPVKELGLKSAGRAAIRRSTTRGVIYLGHIPHGFYEEQMKGFFSQFGQVTNLKLFRSLKTGRSKGYAFIEFKYAEVAKVVAETMNNYLMLHKILKCEVIPPERVHRGMFRHNKVDEKNFPTLKRRKMQKNELNKIRDEEQQQNRLLKQEKKLEVLKSKLSALGVEYGFELKLPKWSKKKSETKSVDELSNDTENTDNSAKKRKLSLKSVATKSGKALKRVSGKQELYVSKNRNKLSYKEKEKMASKNKKLMALKGDNKKKLKKVHN